MGAGGGETEHGIAGAHGAPVDDGVLLDHADTEAGQVVVLAVVHAGHLGGLAADQRRARLRAALGDAAITRVATSTSSWPVAK